jgi:hypothetical protein
MNIIFDFIFEDETPYSVVLNLDELEKRNHNLKKFVKDVRNNLNSGGSSLEVDYDIFCEIWNVWKEDGVRPSYPVMVHGDFTLYQV